MLVFHTVWRGIAVFAGLFVLVACGGGSGGGGEDDTDGPSNSNRGAFTLSGSAATFVAVRFNPTPPQQAVSITLNDTATTKLVAGFPTGQATPIWLDMHLSGSAPNFTLTLFVTRTDIASGPYTATVLLATTDAADAVLQTKQLTVTYNLAAGIRATPSISSAPFVFGSSDTTKAFTLNVEADGLPWTITSDASWLAVPAGTRQGSSTVPLTIDASSLSPGQYQARITVRADAASAIPAHVLVGALVRLPAFTITPEPVVLGGSDGIGEFAQSLGLTLDTGTNSYPWSVLLSDTQGAGWLHSSAPSGSVNGTTANLMLSADVTGLQPWKWLGLARFSVDVRGQVISKDVPVILNLESQRLFVDFNGVGLSSLRTTRSLLVKTTRGRAAAWTAQADQPWLTVTPSGTTGTFLQISADQSSLPVNQLSLGTVTLTTNDPAIGPESIRVGFWRLAANPANVDVALTGNSRALATNPVEPYAYHSLAESPVIAVYNVYTGALVTQFAGPAVTVDALTTSSDGRVLFVTDATGGRTYALDAASGSLVDTYPQSSDEFSDPMGLVYSRPNGHAVLWTPHNQVIDVENRMPAKLTSGGSAFFKSSFRVRRAASPDGLDLFETSTIATDSSVERWSQRFSVLGERALDMMRLGGPGSGGGQGGFDMCVSGTGSTFATLGNPTQRWSITPTAVNNPDTLPLPASAIAVAVACGWNGRIYVGLTTDTSPQNNLYVFGENGEPAAPPTLSGPDNSGRYFRKLRLSGDGKRAVSTVIAPPSTTYLTFYEAP